MTYRPKFFDLIEFSLGVKNYQLNNERKSNTALGFGLLLDDIEFHYAYEKSDHISFDNKNYFSLNMNI